MLRLLPLLVVLGSNEPDTLRQAKALTDTMGASWIEGTYLPEGGSACPWNGPFLREPLIGQQEIYQEALALVPLLKEEMRGPSEARAAQARFYLRVIENQLRLRGRWQRDRDAVVRLPYRSFLLGFILLLGVSVGALYRRRAREREDPRAVAQALTVVALFLTSLGFLAYGAFAEWQSYVREYELERALRMAGWTLAGGATTATFLVVMAWIYGRHAALGVTVFGIVAFLVAGRVEIQMREPWPPDRIKKLLEEEEERRLSEDWPPPHRDHHAHIGPAWFEEEDIQRGEGLLHGTMTAALLLTSSAWALSFFIRRRRAHRDPGRRAPLHGLVAAGVLCTAMFVLSLTPAHVRMSGVAHHVEDSMRELAMAEEAYRAFDLDGNGLRDYWMGDVAGLNWNKGRKGYPLRLVSTGIAAADAAPLEPPDDDVRWIRSPRTHEPEAFSYRFLVIPRKAQAKDLVTGNDFRGRDGYAFCAFPARYNVSGRNTYVINEDGAVWRRNLGGRPVLQWPADLRAEGWERLD